MREYYLLATNLVYSMSSPFDSMFYFNLTDEAIGNKAPVII